MWDIGRFRREEDGALLVFFAICSAAIFLIAALSFDVGRRASTQTDLQSFADNVALAAAGELDGLPGSMARARRAADELIDDSTRFSDDNDLGGLDDFDLTFYATLPTNEGAWASPLFYDVAQSFNADDDQARFVRIQVEPRDVEWQFANILSIFSSDPLPDEAVSAEATAGFTVLACDVAPVFFCLPPAQPEDITAGSSIWDPENHIGDSILLRTGGGTNPWDPGNFGFLDVVRTFATRELIDPASPCFGMNGSPLYNCLIGVEAPATLCFENNRLGFLPGQGAGISPDVLNTKFDMYGSGMAGFENSARFRSAPVVTKPYAQGATCSAGGGAAADNSTTDFPLDDCFNGGAGCLNVGGEPRFGNGRWREGRRDYVENNYSVDGDSIGTITSDERVGRYHIDDPFRPAIPAQGGNPAVPRKPEYLSNPVLRNNTSRWNYYNAEVAAAYFADPALAYDNAVGEVNLLEAFAATPTDLITDYVDSDGNVVQTRTGTSLPHCAADFSRDPRRRTLVVAGVNCGAQAGQLGGAGEEGAATWFFEVFLPSASDDASVSGNFDMHVEVISGGLQTGDPSFATGNFRSLVQLYR